METGFLNGYDLKNMLESGLACLEDRHKEIDSLNVFPVPDGDTGTNMFLTMAATVEEACNAVNPASIGDVAEAASRGALMGARGNSGVIMSQLLRGLAGGLKNKNKATGTVFANALGLGVKVAFKAVMKPVEGTILTVARTAAEAAVRAAESQKNVALVISEACSAAEETLDRTPDMLPALKEAGVVDAGGMGWMVVLNGFSVALEGQKSVSSKQPVLSAGSVKPIPRSSEGNLEYPYCTELLIKNQDADTRSVGDLLNSLGDSMMVVNGDGFTKVHIHSSHPGEVLEICLQFGSLTGINVTNMNERLESVTVPESAPPVDTVSDPKSGEDSGNEPFTRPQKDISNRFGIVSVAFGEGIKKIMVSLGSDVVVNGGQTMNPSTQELKEAVDSINADTVFILPNNSNIVMTARQVADLTEKKVEIIPTRTIPEGVSALLAFSPESDNKVNVRMMDKAYKSVKTGEVTYAVRDTTVKGSQINKDSIIGLADNKIIVSGDEPAEVVERLFENMVTEDEEVCTLYYGDRIKQSEAEQLVEKLQKNYPDFEFEIHNGGQPLYYYIISIE